MLMSSSASPTRSAWSAGFSMYTPKGTLDRDAQLRQYAPLVHRLAHLMIARLPASVELDDLIQVGMIGLTEALARYEPSMGVQFETFASQRIRGAMLDELRDADWMSRGSRKLQKDIEGAIHRLEQRLQRAPRESEIAQELGMSLAEYQDCLSRMRGTQLVYLEDLNHGSEEEEGFLERFLPEGQDSNPETILADQRMRAALVDAITKLPEREQHVMSMYYEHDMNLKEIAAVLGVTESRVSQIHSQAIARLRARLREH
jgi:RNA polymerase sigma factor for flagellar operon FliA